MRPFLSCVVERHCSGRLTVGAVLFMVFPAQGAEPLDTVVQAYRATSRELKSCSALAMYREFQGPDAEHLTLITDADVEIYFRDSKYALAPTYSLEPRGTRLQRILADETSITATRFSERIHPLGADTRITNRAGVNTAFPWDVSKLFKGALDVEVVSRNVARDLFTIEQTPVGDIDCVFRVKNSESGRVEFRCLRGRRFCSIMVSSSR
jgi:hypothetical protein